MIFSTPRPDRPNDLIGGVTGLMRRAIQHAPKTGLRSRKPDSGRAGTISLTIRVRQAGWNVMKPRIQGVLTP
jgi:hypothetical protein